MARKFFARRAPGRVRCTGEMKRARRNRRRELSELSIQRSDVAKPRVINSREHFREGF